MFNRYYSRGLLYININKKTNKKYQFHFEEGQFMDETDTFISGIISKTIGMTNELLQAYAQKYGGRAIIALTCTVDWEGYNPIDGDEPYYLYIDYDGYFSIVQVNGINIIPCKGVPENMTEDYEPSYLGNYIFCYHDSEVSENWTLYNAKIQKTISTNYYDEPYIFNNKYINYKDADGNNNIVDTNTMQTVLRTNKLISDLNSQIRSSKNPVEYSDDLFYIVDSFYNDGKYDKNIRLFNIANHKSIISTKDYNLGKYKLDGKEYLILKCREADTDGEFNGRFKSILIYPDGKLSKPFYNDDIAIASKGRSGGFQG